MLLLAVDTSAPCGSLAVLRDHSLLGVVSTDVEETYSSRMFRQLRFLLGELALELSRFDAFAVAAGPGSFTGLRVGLTSVKGWAEVFGKPIAAVSGLEAVAAQGRDARGLLVPFLDARRGQVYTGLYQANGERLERRAEEIVLTPAELLDWLCVHAEGQPLTFLSPTPEVLRGALAPNFGPGNSAHPGIRRVSPVLAPVIARIGFDHICRGEAVDALHLDANYIRRSDAELLWKGA